MTASLSLGEAAVRFTLTPAQVALAGTLVTATVALLGPLISARAQNLMTDRTLFEQRARILLERRTRQLNELYGPLLLLRRQSRYLAQQLREGKQDPDGWRIMDHLDEVLDIPADRSLAEAILEINDRIQKLIIEGAGLLHTTTPPDSFVRFIGHCQVLRIALTQRVMPPANEFIYFPTELDDDVDAAYRTIRADIEAILEGDPRVILPAVTAEH